MFVRQVFATSLSGSRHCIRQQCTIPPSWQRIIREEQPSKIHNDPYEGEVLIEEKTTLTDVEVSHDPSEWQHVERLLPKMTVPEVPHHKSYPTPSGWFPQTAKPGELPYHVNRTRFHNFPVYLEEFQGGSRKMTCIRKVDGDIWTLDSEIRDFLMKKHNKTMYTQVDEIGCKLRVRGIFVEDVAEFLKEKGL